MNWREKTIARILLILAMLIAEDSVLKKELAQLDLHIRAYKEE